MKTFLLIASLALVVGCTDTDVKTGYVPVDHGRLYYEEAGTGTPLIMLHGGYLDSRMWDAQFELYSKTHRVIRYDIRSHGRSNSDSVEFADYDDLYQLCQSLKIDQAIVMGLSMGGQIAIDFALQYPAKVAGLILVGPGLGGFNFDSPEVDEYIEKLTAAFGSNDFDAVNEVFAQYWCDGPQRTPDQVAPAVRGKVLEMLAGSTERWEHYQLVQYLDPPSITRLEEIKVPTLLVLGLLDMPVIFEVAQVVLERIPDARKVEIEGAAHMVNLDQPEVFNRAVSAFLAEL